MRKRVNTPGVAMKSIIPDAQCLRQELKPAPVSNFKNWGLVAQRQKGSGFDPHHSKIDTWRGWVQRDRQTDGREREGERRGEQTQRKIMTVPRHWAFSQWPLWKLLGISSWVCVGVYVTYLHTSTGEKNKMQIQIPFITLVFYLTSLNLIVEWSWGIII